MVGYDPESLMYVTKQYEENLKENVKKIFANDVVRTNLDNINRILDEELAKCDALLDEISAKADDISGYRNDVIRFISNDDNYKISDLADEELKNTKSHPSTANLVANRSKTAYKTYNFSNETFKYEGFDSVALKGGTPNPEDKLVKFEIPVTESETLKVVEFGITWRQSPEFVHLDAVRNFVTEDAVVVNKVYTGRFFIIRPDPKNHPEHILIKAIVKNSDNTGSYTDEKVVDVRAMNESRDVITSDDMGPEFDFYFTQNDPNFISICIGNIIPHKWAIKKTYVNNGIETPASFNITDPNFSDFKISKIYYSKNLNRNILVDDVNQKVYISNPREFGTAIELEIRGNKLPWTPNIWCKDVGDYFFIGDGKNTFVCVNKLANALTIPENVEDAKVMSNGEIIIKVKDDLWAFDPDASENLIHDKIASFHTVHDGELPNGMKVATDFIEIANEYIMMISTIESGVWYKFVRLNGDTGLYNGSLIISGEKFLEVAGASTTGAVESKVHLLEAPECVYLAVGYISNETHFGKTFALKNLDRTDSSYEFKNPVELQLYDKSKPEAKNSNNIIFDRLIDTTLANFGITDDHKLYVIDDKHILPAVAFKPIIEKKTIKNEETGNDEVINETIGYTDEYSYFKLDKNWSAGEYFSNTTDFMQDIRDVYEVPNGIFVADKNGVYEITADKELKQKLYLIGSSLTVLSNPDYHEGLITIIVVSEINKLTSIYSQNIFNVEKDTQSLRYKYFDLYNGKYGKFDNSEFEKPIKGSQWENWDENADGPIINFHAKLYVSLVDRTGSIYNTYTSPDDIIKVDEIAFKDIDPNSDHSVLFRRDEGMVTASPNTILYRLHGNKFGFVKYDGFKPAEQPKLVSNINDAKNMVIIHRDGDPETTIDKVRNQILKIIKKAVVKGKITAAKYSNVYGIDKDKNKVVAYCPVDPITATYKKKDCRFIGTIGGHELFVDGTTYNTILVASPMNGTSYTVKVFAAAAGINVGCFIKNTPRGDFLVLPNTGIYAITPEAIESSKSVNLSNLNSFICAGFNSVYKVATHGRILGIDYIDDQFQHLIVRCAYGSFIYRCFDPNGTVHQPFVDAVNLVWIRRNDLIAPVTVAGKAVTVKDGGYLNKVFYANGQIYLGTCYVDDAVITANQKPDIVNNSEAGNSGAAKTPGNKQLYGGVWRLGVNADFASNTVTYNLAEVISATGSIIFDKHDDTYLVDGLNIYAALNYNVRDTIPSTIVNDLNRTAVCKINLKNDSISYLSEFALSKVTGYNEHKKKYYIADSGLAAVSYLSIATRTDFGAFFNLPSIKFFKIGDEVYCGGASQLFKYEDGKFTVVNESPVGVLFYINDRLYSISTDVVTIRYFNFEKKLWESVRMNDALYFYNANAKISNYNNNHAVCALNTLIPTNFGFYLTSEDTSTATGVGRYGTRFIADREFKKTAWNAKTILETNEGDTSIKHFLNEDGVEYKIKLDGSIMFGDIVIPTTEPGRPNNINYNENDGVRNIYTPTKDLYPELGKKYYEVTDPSYMPLSGGLQSFDPNRVYFLRSLQNPLDENADENFTKIDENDKPVEGEEYFKKMASGKMLSLGTVEEFVPDNYGELNYYKHRYLYNRLPATAKPQDYPIGTVFYTLANVNYYERVFTDPHDDWNSWIEQYDSTHKLDYKNVDNWTNESTSLSEYDVNRAKQLYHDMLDFEAAGNRQSFPVANIYFEILKTEPCNFHWVPGKSEAWYDADRDLFIITRYDEKLDEYQTITLTMGASITKVVTPFPVFKYYKTSVARFTVYKRPDNTYGLAIFDKALSRIIRENLVYDTSVPESAGKIANPNDVRFVREISEGNIYLSIVNGNNITDDTTSKSRSYKIDLGSLYFIDQFDGSYFEDIEYYYGEVFGIMNRNGHLTIYKWTNDITPDKDIVRVFDTGDNTTFVNAKFVHVHDKTGRERLYVIGCGSKYNILKYDNVVFNAIMPHYNNTTALFGDVTTFEDMIYILGEVRVPDLTAVDKWLINPKMYIIDPNNDEDLEIINYFSTSTNDDIYNYEFDDTSEFIYSEEDKIIKFNIKSKNAPSLITRTGEIGFIDPAKYSIQDLQGGKWPIYSDDYNVQTTKTIYQKAERMNNLLEDVQPGLRRIDNELRKSICPFQSYDKEHWICSTGFLDETTLEPPSFEKAWRLPDGSIPDFDTMLDTPLGLFACQDGILYLNEYKTDFNGFQQIKTMASVDSDYRKFIYSEKYGVFFADNKNILRYDPSVKNFIVLENSITRRNGAGISLIKETEVGIFIAAYNPRFFNYTNRKYGLDYYSKSKNAFIPVIDASEDDDLLNRYISEVSETSRGVFVVTNQIPTAVANSPLTVNPNIDIQAKNRIFRIWKDEGNTLNYEECQYNNLDDATFFPTDMSQIIEIDGRIFLTRASLYRNSQEPSAARRRAFECCLWEYKKYKLDGNNAKRSFGTSYRFEPMYDTATVYATNASGIDPSAYIADGTGTWVHTSKGNFIVRDYHSNQYHVGKADCPSMNESYAGTQITCKGISLMRYPTPPLVDLIVDPTMDRLILSLDTPVLKGPNRIRTSAEFARSLVKLFDINGEVYMVVLTAGNTLVPTLARPYHPGYLSIYRPNTEPEQPGWVEVTSMMAPINIDMTAYEAWNTGFYWDILEDCELNVIGGRIFLSYQGNLYEADDYTLDHVEETDPEELNNQVLYELRLIVDNQKLYNNLHEVTRNSNIDKFVIKEVGIIDTDRLDYINDDDRNLTMKSTVGNKVIQYFLPHNFYNIATGEQAAVAVENGIDLKEYYRINKLKELMKNAYYGIKNMNLINNRFIKPDQNILFDAMKHETDTVLGDVEKYMRNLDNFRIDLMIYPTRVKNDVDTPFVDEMI